MEKQNLRFTVELSEKDYLNYQLDHNQIFKSKRWIIYAIMFLIILFASIIPSIIDGDFSIDTIIGALPIFIPVLLVGFVFYSVRTRVKHSFKSDPFAKHPYEVEITDTALITNGYNANINCAWEDIYRFSKTKRAVYIYVSDLKSVIIPLRYFHDNAQLDFLISLLTKKVNPQLYNELKRKTSISRIVVYSILGLILFWAIFSVFGSNPNDRQLKAAKLEENGEYQKAKSIYSDLISEYPQSEFHYVSRAYCEIKLNEFSQAQTDCEKAIELNPKSGEAYYYYAYALNNEGRFNEACEAMTRSKELGFKGDSEGFCENIKDTLN